MSNNNPDLFTQWWFRPNTCLYVISEYVVKGIIMIVMIPLVILCNRILNGFHIVSCQGRWQPLGHGPQ